MPSNFNVNIITPTKIINEEQVEYVRAPSIDGLFGVQKGHAPTTLILSIGEIKINKNGKEIFYASSGGFAEINNNLVTILVESVENSNDIDANRAEESKKRALERIKDKKNNSLRAQLSLQRAINRLKISRK